MTVKTKIIIHIVATLLLGLALGVAIDRLIIRHRIRSIVEMRDAGLMGPLRAEIMELAAPEAKPSIEEILSRHGRLLADIHLKYRDEIEAAFKSLKKELSSLMTTEQMKKLDVVFPGRPPFMNRPPRGFFNPGGPPFFGMDLAELKRRLELSDEQSAKAEAVLERYREQEKELMKTGPSPEKIDLLREARRRMETEIETLLTEKQKQIFRRYLEERPKMFPRGPGAGPDRDPFFD